ncbi:MAG: hypothetical protein ACREJB_13770, partial [Planctomycetaceae bacterium]
SIPAQSFWLKANPPPDWQADASPLASLSDDVLSRMTDDQFDLLLNTVAREVADGAAAGMDAPPCPPLAELLP